MTKLKKFAEKIDSQMKADYLAGIALIKIAEKYELADKTSVYYHIGPLTPMEKAVHAENRARREQNGK